MTEKLAELYPTDLLRDTQFHGETHLLDKIEMLGHVVILDEESEGIVSTIMRSEVKMSH